jgi:YHS domain-containing protein
MEMETVPIEKEIGSISFFGEDAKGNFETFDDFLTSSTDKVVIGRVESVTDVTEGEIPWTIYNFVVYEILFCSLGKSEKQIEMLRLCLLGAPDSHTMTTKPNIGDKLVLVLSTQDGNYYGPVNFEQGLFRIEDDGTVYSFSNEESTAQFDGKPLSFLQSEISSILENYNRKLVGSRYAPMSRLSYNDFSDMVQSVMHKTTEITVDGVTTGESVNVGKIVIGEVKSAEVHGMYMHEKEDGDRFDPPEFIYTSYNIVVNETIFGNEVDSIDVHFEGVPDSHYGITKPDIGDNLLLFVWEDLRENSPTFGSYGLMSFEESIFRIEDDGTLYSFSDEIFVARFDGNPLKTLKNEMSRSMKELDEAE